MQCYTELTPPTAVTHCVSIAFTGPKASNLVVVKTSLLQIFEARVINAPPTDAVRTETRLQDLQNGEQYGQEQDTEPTTKLVLLGEYSLSGTVTALAKVKALNTKAGGEALIIASKDAKLSLVEWDPESYSLATISLHYYERDDLQGSPFAPSLNHCVSYLTVDPSSRCAAFKFGVRSLAILPFRQAGDDLVMGDYDPDLDGQPTSPVREEKKELGDDEASRTPYNASFVLSLTALDPTLTHPVHLCFLHEYREPTFGILSAPIAPSVALLPERRDPVVYSVFTLDLEQRASTTLLSVTGLPYDIFKVVPLPPPVGGSLLLGTNEIIHVDQAGKTNAIGVNEFARQCSSFAMADRSDLNLRLEGCVAEQLSSEAGDMLLILENGALITLSFQMDGRSISSLSLSQVTAESGGFCLFTGASCASFLGRSRLFIGSEKGDSVVIGWSRKTPELSKKRSIADMLGEEDMSFSEEDMDDLEDDLYGAAPAVANRDSGTTTGPGTPEDYRFRVHDSLLNAAPLSHVTFGNRTTSSETNSETMATSEKGLQIVAATGSGRAGALRILAREIDPTVIQQSAAPFDHRVWSVHVRRLKAGSSSRQQTTDSSETKAQPEDAFDEYVITSKIVPMGAERSAIHAITLNGLEEKTDTDFATDEGLTVEVGTLAGHTVLAQVLATQIRTYNAGE